MAHIDILADDLSLDEPMMVEGLPGVGLVGKIAADHLVDEFEMVHYANVHCNGIPRVAVYADDDAELRTPVRIYADEERDLLVLQSDVPIHPQAATEFATCIRSWFEEDGVVPIFLSGIGEEKSDDVPALYGVATGEGTTHLEQAGIGRPTEVGIVTGPTGALMNHVLEHHLTSIGLVVESDPQFPDPEAARVIIKDGIEPLTGIECPVDDLVNHTEEIREAKQRFAQRMQEVDEESTQAQPLRMYQ
ncbi:proteasome assembly chaperone family protein [Halogranum rubrum]|uniref:ATP-grasp superfamily enzyme n=1 Tax=Halogranum salarium B-1 TaxID=1210908 RepID=J3JHP1_9EURY|nr:PAC2 family protein [Halogranum salarium]EJN61156.1 ATP-grasp superfamily enzyme [Halogranum salarium B-1]